MLALLLGLCLSGAGSAKQPRIRVAALEIQSKLLHRKMKQLVVTPAKSEGRPLLVLLHGRGGGPASFLTGAFAAGLEALGRRAPDVLLANGGNHSYFHNRRSGRWGSYVLQEAIPAALRTTGADRKRIAVGGVSMGGFGALNLARKEPKRFCAVGAHSPALWESADQTAPGAFDDAADFGRNDVIGAARHRLPYRMPVWLDVGTEDPFRSADTYFAGLLLARRGNVTFHAWPGTHGPTYWYRHMRRYLKFYAHALATCR